MTSMTQERRIEIALMTPQSLQAILLSIRPDAYGEEEIEWAKVCLSEKDRPSADETITQIEDRMDGRMDGNAGNKMRSPESPYYVMGWHEGSTSDEDEMELD